MRRILLIALALTGSLGAQTPEPEYNDVFYRLENGKLLPLERQAPRGIKGSAHSFLVVITVKGYAVLQGGRSPVRFHAGEPLEFIVHSQLQSILGTDPATMYVLRRLNSHRKTRDIELSSGHASLIGAATMGVPAETLPLDFVRYGEGSFRVSAGNLPPGEYALGRTYGTVYCFGVD